MKVIPLHQYASKIDTKTIVQTVASNAADKGCNADEMRKRVRILDAVEKANGATELRLEDADHEFLKGLINNFPFAMASRDLLDIIDQVNNAREPT